MDLVPLSLEPPCFPLISATADIVVFASSNIGTFYAEAREDASQAELVLPPSIGDPLEITCSPVASSQSEVVILCRRGLAIFTVPHMDADSDETAPKTLLVGSFRKIVRRKDTWFLALIEGSSLVTYNLNLREKKGVAEPYVEDKPIYFFNGQFRVNMSAQDRSSVVDTDAEYICVAAEGIVYIDESSYDLKMPIVDFSVDEKRQVLWIACEGGVLHAINFEGGCKTIALSVSPLSIAAVSLSPTEGWDLYIGHEKGISQLHLASLEDMKPLNRDEPPSSLDQDSRSNTDDSHELMIAQEKINELEQVLKVKDSIIKDLKEKLDSLSDKNKPDTPVKTTRKTRAKEKQKRAAPISFEEAVRAAMSGNVDECTAYIEGNFEEFQRFLLNAPLEHAQLIRLIFISSLPGTDIARRCRAEIGNPIIDQTVFDKIMKL